MKRLARILGVIGGIGAVLWAMRDRLVSVAIPREPKLPGFRVPPSPTPKPADETAEEPAAATEPQARSTTDVHGIGPVYATRLEAAGITTVSDLANSRPGEVSAAAEVAESRARGWIDDARALLEG
ncbi:MAG: helix-hairpin-helix domain-containing protein [Actinomycetota bacterium]